MDERCSPAGPGGLAGGPGLRGVRDCSRSVTQEIGPPAGPESIAASVELLGRHTCFTGRTAEQHARRQAEQLPTAHFVLRACGVNGQSQAGTRCGERRGCAGGQTAA